MGKKPQKRAGELVPASKKLIPENDGQKPADEVPRFLVQLQ